MPEDAPQTISDPLGVEDIVIVSPLDSGEAMTAMERAGRRGRLPGFEKLTGRTFRVDCDSIPFEYAIAGTIEGGTADAPEGAGSRITLRVYRKQLMPMIFAVVLIFTVWPGVWLTDSLIATYWSAYGGWSRSMPWLTYAWYLPITALPLPWIWKSLTGKSAAMARESAGVQIAALRAELGADAPKA